MLRQTAFIALGSNLGDRAANLAAAIAALAANDDVEVVRVATAIETAPIDCPPGSQAFLNYAAELSTFLPPLALLDVLQSIEHDLGRRRSVRNAPRSIDLDLLLYGDLVLNDLRLVLPHPRMHERRFVLEPLAAIAPMLIHPTFGRTVQQLLDALPAQDPGVR